MLKHACVATLTAVLLATSAFPQAADPLPRSANPEEVGLSTERLERIGRVTQAHVETDVPPGAVILIARKGKIAYFKSFGYRDRAKNIAMTTNAIFRIYSMTKPITAVAVMMLQEEGKLQISDAVSRYLPELAKLKVGVESTDPKTGQKTFETVDASREITVQDLLRHTSGFTYDSQGETPVHKLIRDAGVGSRDDSNEVLVTKLAKLPLLYQPGTRWEYSVSMDVLGRLIEVISGKSLGAFFEERIFRPLGMDDTAFSLPPEKVQRAAQPWARPGDQQPITPRFDVAAKPRFESGGGGLVSTAADYLRFAQMLLNGGEFKGVRLLGRKTVEFMTADHLGTIPGQQPGMGWGLGFQVRRDAGIAGLPGSVGEYGWAGNAGTIFWVDPKEQLIAIYMIQVSDGDRIYLRNQFRSLVSQTLVDGR